MGNCETDMISIYWLYKQGYVRNVFIDSVSYPNNLSYFYGPCIQLYNSLMFKLLKIS